MLFGEGRSLFGLDNGGSDIGYVNQIFAGGFVYLSILLSFEYYLFKKYNYCFEDNLFFTILFLTLLVANIKGNAFFVSLGFTRFIILYLIISLKIYNDKRIE